MPQKPAKVCLNVIQGCLHTMAAKSKAIKSSVAKLAPKNAPPPADPKPTRVPLASVETIAAPKKAAATSGQTRPAQPGEGQAEPRSAASTAPALKMKDLIDKVVTSTGKKKADIREIIEATLGALGDALANGDTLNLPPFGRAKVSRAAEAGSGKAMTIKLRRPSAAGSGSATSKQALADTDD